MRREVRLAGWLVFALVLPVGATSARASGPDPAVADVAARRQALLQLAAATYDAEGAKPGLAHAAWIAEALMELNRPADAMKVANAALEKLEPGNKINRWLYGGNSGFDAWPDLDFYIRYKDRLDEATRQHFARIYQGAVFYRRLTTSNHKLMAATERYLATQEWGDHFAPDPLYAARPDADAGTRFAVDDPTGERFLNQRIAATIRSGSEEYASRPYGGQDILPYLTLAECSRDPAMAARARQAYLCAIAELAGTYLRGHVATFSTRSYPDLLSRQPWGVGSVLWAYFGGEGTRPTIDWGLRTATSTLTLPAAILAAGTDRTQPYTQRSTNGGWKLTTFMTDSYAVFSRSPKGNARPPVLLGQNYPCGVMFVEPDATRHSFAWLTNPCADDADKRRPTGIHTHGATNNEQEVQHDGTLLDVFNLPATAPFPYALGFLPGGAQASINDAATQGRIFIAYRSVLLAISSTTNFPWNPQGGIQFPAAEPEKGDSEFRIPGPRIAVAIEAARSADVAGATPEEKLKTFAAQVRGASALELDTVGGAVSGHYRDRLGNDLVCVFGDTDRVNQADVDYAAWPRLENPWMNFIPPDALRLHTGNAEETLQFDSSMSSSRAH
jgi:hypothetical protein